MPILITKRLPLLFCLLIFAGVIFLPSLTRAEVEIHLTSPDGSFTVKATKLLKEIEQFEKNEKKK